MAQRLVRTICRHCKEPVVPDPESLPPDAGIMPGQAIYRGGGCRECRNTGYRGRIGIFELVVLNDELRELIVQHASSPMLLDAAKRAGMRQLREDGWEKVREGLTTPEEVLRVTKI